MEYFMQHFATARQYMSNFLRYDVALSFWVFSAGVLLY